MVGLTPAGTAYPPRLVGVDLARLLALVGMFAAHVTAVEDGEVPVLFQVVAGRSSALFALLAGVSLVIVTRATSAGNLGVHRARLLVRAGMVALVGMVLGVLDSGVAVILVYYGLLFCCALPVLRWRASSLAWLALAWGVASPVVSVLLRPALPPTSYQVPSLLSLADPWQLLTELAVTGYYPVLTWATYLFAGMAAGRALTPALIGTDGDRARAGGGPTGRARSADHRVPLRTLRTLLLVGAWLAALSLGVSVWATRSPAVRQALLQSWGVTDRWGDLATELRTGFYGTHPEGSWWWLAVWAPHSGSVVDLAHTTGCALLVLGSCLVLVRVTAALPWRVLAGAGAMTLSLYAAHVVVLSTPAGQEGALGREGEHALLLHGAAAVLVGAGFALARRRGPLERGVAAVTVAAVPGAGPTRPGNDPAPSA